MTTTEDRRPFERRFTEATIGLSLGAAVFFFGSISWVLHRNWWITALCQYAFATDVACFTILLAAQLVYLSRGPRLELVTVYSFPRRFGLGTLLAFTLAYGALTAFCQWFQWPTEVVLGILIFFGLVSAMQFLFDRAPRQASILMGVLYVTAWLVIWWINHKQRVLPFRTGDLTFFTALAAINGAVAGYFVGTLVGSVFMFMAGAGAILKKATARQANHA